MSNTGDRGREPRIALADKAKALGFHHVEIIDCDLGVSAGPGAQAREGFTQLLASVALGDVGIVLSRELSRLWRTGKDWCPLMELCQLFNVLIADADNLYDLNRLDDQLVLGINGTLSVVELKVLKLRLLQGMESESQTALGYRNLRVHGLKQKNVEALVRVWRYGHDQRGWQPLSGGTTKNRMTALRWWAGKIGKPAVIANSNGHYGIVKRQFVTNESKALTRISHR